MSAGGAIDDAVTFAIGDGVGVAEENWNFALWQKRSGLDEDVDFRPSPLKRVKLRASIILGDELRLCGRERKEL